MANILVTALYGNVKGGGSGGYIDCLVTALNEIGHNAIYSRSLNLNQKDFDFVISSHQTQLRQIANWTIPKIHIMQGIVPHEEHPIQGASKYVSISEEVQHFARNKGFESTVIRQPIHMSEKFKPLSAKKNVLYITNSATREISWKIPNLKLSNVDIPINTQIKNNKLSITLGRGALETMALGRPVIIADNRFYQGRIGDGYITEDNFYEIQKNNFSGRRFKHPATTEWLMNELNSFAFADGKKVFELMRENNEAKMIAKQLVGLV